MEGSRSGYRSSGSGVLTFAAVMIAIVGAFNIVWGLAALFNGGYFFEHNLLFGDLTLWGIIALVIGAIEVFTAMAIANRQRGGQYLGIFIVSVNAIHQLLAVAAYPIWSIIILFVDGIIIYGLTVHSDAFD